MTIAAGFDAGGAHLKVARVDGARVVAARQIALPLWRGLDQLDAALDAAADLARGADVVAVTMTGELTEIFASREAGTEAIIGVFARRFGAGVRFLLGLDGFGSPEAALRHTSRVGSANFLATARFIAAVKPESLLIDMGSTTTDIIAVSRPQGLTDAERLQTGELVYTGLTRTPVPSITTRAPLLGTWQTLARDTFATMADVRRILGELDDGIDEHETADGKGKSVEESLVRLARGFGRDADMRHLPVWRVAARAICDAQVRSIVDGTLQVLSRPGMAVGGGAVVAGAGAQVAAEAARRLGLAAQDFSSLVDASPEIARAVTQHATAVAVARLALA